MAQTALTQPGEQPEAVWRPHVVVRPTRSVPSSRLPDRVRRAVDPEAVEGHVARLAARLEREPGDVAGWVMLMRSYQTLGREGEARAALRRAVAANPGRTAEIEAAAEGLGVS